MRVIRRYRLFLFTQSECIVEGIYFWYPIPRGARWEVGLWIMSGAEKTIRIISCRFWVWNNSKMQWTIEIIPSCRRSGFIILSLDFLRAFWIKPKGGKEKDISVEKIRRWHHLSPIPIILPTNWKLVARTLILAQRWYPVSSIEHPAS